VGSASSDLFVCLLEMFVYIGKNPRFTAFLDSNLHTRLAIVTENELGLAINYKCCGIFSNQSKKGLLLIAPVKNYFRLMNIWHSYGQKVDCVARFLSVSSVVTSQTLIPWTVYRYFSACPFFTF